MFLRLKEDIKAVFDRDPAARSVPEIIFCYPGLHAIWFHRISHWFWQLGVLLHRQVCVASRPFFHRDRDPSGGPDRQRFFYRPRHGGRDRGDSRDRRQRNPLPRCNTGGGELGKDQAASHHRGQCGNRLRRQGSGAVYCRQREQVSAPTPWSSGRFQPTPRWWGFPAVW